MKRKTEKSSEWFRLLIQNWSDPIFSFNADRTFQFANNAFAVTLGKEMEEIIKKTPYDIFSQEEAEKYQKCINQVFISGEKIEFESKMKTVSGETRYYQVAASLTRDRSGIACLVVCLAKDITERKKIEEELKMSEEKYKLITDNAADVITVLDMNLKINYVSPSVFRLRGYTPEEAMTQKLEEILTAESLVLAVAVFTEELALEVVKTADSKRVRILEVEEFCKDGSKIWAEVSVTFLRDQNQAPIGMITVSRDITKRKQVEKELQNEIIRFRTLSEQSPFGIVIIRKDGTFDYVNSKFKELFGYELSDIPDGKAWFKKAFPDPDYQRHVIGIWMNDLDKFKQGEKRPEIFTARCKDGTDKIINFIPVQLVTGENFMICEDITEQKRQEEERLKIGKLESLGVLAGGIAHDFNNLLQQIMGRISMAVREKNLEKKNQHLDSALAAVEMSSRLAQQLLAFAKGGISEREAGSVVKIIRESVGMSLGKSSLVGCEMNLPENLWLAEVNSGQISQVIRNLVINAWQAMSKGGIIRIRAENIVLPSDNRFFVKGGQYVHVSIKDNGVGIPKKNLSKIFDPYFTTKEEGSGLGLAICYTVMKNHRGSITVESKEGRGSTFHLFLPTTSKGLKKNEQIEKVLDPFRKFKILFMDDEDLTRIMVKEMLEDLGHKTEVAKNGEETIAMYSLELAAKKPFDFVILDMTIPSGMGGIETLKNLQVINPQIIAVVSSGYSNVFPDGFAFSLPKPYSMEMLEETINKIRKTLQ